MVDAITKARARLDEVVDQGEKLLGTKKEAQWGGDYLTDEAGYAAWRMSAKTVLHLLDPGGHHEDEFNEIDKDTNAWSGPARKLTLQLGVLKALRENFDGGYLSNIRSLVRGEVFADFIGQARHLFDEGYWQVVPALLGAVLEDHLRKLCAKHPNIVLPQNPSIGWMNVELAKVQEYGGVEPKEVLMWAGLRNSSAHGKWGEFKPINVEGMLRDVPRFLIDHKL